MENIKCNLPKRPPGGTAAILAVTDRPGWFVVLPWLAYLAIIFYGSSLSRWIFEPPDFFTADKLYHFAEYALLGLLTVRVFRAYAPEKSSRVLIGWAAGFGLLYGIGDELHQWFVPGRFAAVGDVLADALGSWAGAWLYVRIIKGNRP